MTGARRRCADDDDGHGVMVSGVCKLDRACGVGLRN